jgi:PAS domain S-box-containing protein
MLKRIKIFWKLSAAFIIIILLVLVILNIVDYLVWKPANAEGVDDNGIWATRRILLVIALTIVLGGVTARIFVKLFISRPVGILVDGMDKLADKQFDVRLDEDRKDEFEDVAFSFNDTAAILSSSLTELQKIRDYLQGIVDGSADIIITVTPSGKIRSFNTGAQAALGYRRRDVLGKPIEMLFADPNDRKAALERLKYSDNVVNYETRFVTKGGEIKIVLLTLSRLRNSEGDIVGTFGISKDITDEKRLQEQLMQSERFAAIGQVFTGIQHSMKNMLNACKGGAYMVRTGLSKDDREMLVDGWGMVEEGISRMTDMSMNMLKYVKDFKPTYNSVDMGEVLSEVDHVIRQTAKDRGVKFRLNVASGLPSVVCDRGMIHSAMMDIVSNAVDACVWKDYDEGETPEIVAKAYVSDDGEESVVEIKDNGCGMTEEVKAAIFTPFFSTKSKAGTGLGLSITSRMISVHGGRIDVESEPDVGTVFRIVLPIDRTSTSKENIDGKKGSGSR